MKFMQVIDYDAELEIRTETEEEKQYEMLYKLFLTEEAAGTLLRTVISELNEVEAEKRFGKTKSINATPAALMVWLLGNWETGTFVQRWIGEKKTYEQVHEIRRGESYTNEELSIYANPEEYFPLSVDIAREIARQGLERYKELIKLLDRARETVEKVVGVSEELEMRYKSLERVLNQGFERIRSRAEELALGFEELKELIEVKRNVVKQTKVAVLRLAKSIDEVNKELKEARQELQRLSKKSFIRKIMELPLWLFSWWRRKKERELQRKKELLKRIEELERQRKAMKKELEIRLERLQEHYKELNSLEEALEELHRRDKGEDWGPGL
jgi:DNA repair exonuclease SbcCD ATPase subunit